MLKAPVIAFIGLGIMGNPMCRRLLHAGHSVRVWNRTRVKAESLAPLGALVCDGAAAAVSGADFVFCMLETGDVIDSVLFDAKGAAVAGMAEQATLIVMSSIPVAAAQRQAAFMSGRQRHYIDAPVSGGERGAIAGTLTIMAGGEHEVIERARSLLELMGRITRVGAVGTGQLAKLANQTIVGITIGAVCEALTLAQRGGADIARVREALLGGFADSEILRQHGQRIVERAFVAGARGDIQLKDLRTARGLAEDAGVVLPLLSAAESQYQKLCESGRGSLDHSALYLLWERAVD